MKNAKKAPIISLHDLVRKKSDEFVGKTLVFTSGVFDIPHEGHFGYLRFAAQEGDVFVVGIHSDELVKERKGPSRPKYLLPERITIMSENPNVDLIIVVKDQRHLGQIIRGARPDVLVVSETTTDIENCPKTMTSLYSGYVKSILVKEEFSKRHSTDYIEVREEKILQD